MISVPYFRQQTPHTCGPACLRMIAAYTARPESESRIAKAVGTNAKTGTRRIAMVSYLRKKRIQHRLIRKATLTDIQDALNDGNAVILNFDYHFVVAVAFTKKFIVLHDPEKKSHYRVELQAFLSRWLGYKTKDPKRGWMLVIEHPKEV